MSISHAENAMRREETKGIQETEKALLVRLKDGEEVWVPKAVIHDDSEVYEKGGEGTLIVQRWWAEREEWEDEE